MRNGPDAIFPALVRNQNLETGEKVSAAQAAAQTAFIIVVAVSVAFVLATVYFRNLLEMVARARINLFTVRWRCVNAI